MQQKKLKECFGDCCNGLLTGDSELKTLIFSMFKFYQEVIKIIQSSA